MIVHVIAGAACLAIYTVLAMAARAFYEESRAAPSYSKMDGQASMVVCGAFALVFAYGLIVY